MTQLVVREYLGKNIEFELINGEVYVNVTSLGEPQKLADWKRSKKTVELINELEAMEKSHRLMITENGKGTFIHESLFLDFAQYISVKFKVWCQTQITTLIREGNVQLKPLSVEEMIINQAQSVIELKKEVIEIRNDVKSIINTVTIESNKQRKIQLEIANRVYKLLPEPQPDLDNETIKVLTRKMFSGLHKELRNKFLVSTYKDIKVIDYEKALEFIKEWV